MAGESVSERALTGHVGRRLRPDDIPWRGRLRVLLLWLASVLLAIVFLVAPLPFSGQVALDVGDVAPADVTAPRQVTYISDILTDQRRELAANAVLDVYDPPQARIGRGQLILLNQTLDFIGTVRSDSYADLATKADYLRAVTTVPLPPEVISRTLSLSGPAWERVATEARTVLERAMREEVRDNNLADERRKVPARVRLDMSDDDARIVSTLVEGLLVQNSFFNAERTEQRRQLARDQVESISETVERNETILRNGDIVTPVDVEALQMLGLQQRSWSWDDVWAVSGVVLLLALVLLFYLWRQDPLFWLGWKRPVILSLLVLVFLFAGKVVIPAHAVAPYLFPYAALTLLVALLLDLRLAVVVTALFSLMVGWLTAGNVALMSIAFCAPLVGVLKLQRGEQLLSFVWAAVYVTVVNLAVVGVFWIAEAHGDLRGLAELSAAAIANGLITMTVTLAGVYLVGVLFGVITPLQLIELSRPTHPLLRQLLLKAPGTYHHTLIVSNMAERAAEAIGADALLARVGAYYHDVGKTIRPYFFTENQTEGMSPHERLDPFTSAQVIITHVKDGIDLARKYRLPQQVIDFIPEHQGSMQVSYFYHQAKTLSDDVDESQFCYPGPKPQSRETAITMLADSTEAIVRSRHPDTIEALTEIIDESIRNRVLSGQLDECPLTMEDLRDIRRVFVDVLRGLHHPRIAYPTDKTTDQEPAPLVAEAPAALAAPASPSTPVAAENGDESDG